MTSCFILNWSLDVHDVPKSDTLCNHQSIWILSRIVSLHSAFIGHASTMKTEIQRFLRLVVHPFVNILQIVQFFDQFNLNIAIYNWNLQIFDTKEKSFSFLDFRKTNDLSLLKFDFENDRPAGIKDCQFSFVLCCINVL